jgi:hypothetical protein
MLNEKIFQFKSELRKIRKGDLLRMVLNQKERKCVLGGVCPFLFEYRRILFCVSEILGQGCQVEKQRLDSVREAQSEGENPQKPLKLPVGTWLPPASDCRSEVRVLAKNRATKAFL